MHALTLTLILTTIPLAIGCLLDGSADDAPLAERLVAGFYVWIVGGWLVILYAMPGIAALAEAGHFAFPAP